MMLRIFSLVLIISLNSKSFANPQFDLQITQASTTAIQFAISINDGDPVSRYVMESATVTLARPYAAGKISFAINEVSDRSDSDFINAVPHNDLITGKIFFGENLPNLKFPTRGIYEYLLEINHQSRDKLIIAPDLLIIHTPQNGVKTIRYTNENHSQCEKVALHKTP